MISQAKNAATAAAVVINLGVPNAMIQAVLLQKKSQVTYQFRRKDSNFIQGIQYIHSPTSNQCRCYIYILKGSWKITKSVLMALQSFLCITACVPLLRVKPYLVHQPPSGVVQHQTM